MSGVRSELLAYFTHVLLGDALAAEYLILHLISNVYVSPTELMMMFRLSTTETYFNVGRRLLRFLLI